jgi:hypothetical protein
MKYIVFGYDSNFGHFRQEFDNKKRAYGYYLHRQENADFIEMAEQKKSMKAEKQIEKEKAIALQ